MRSHNPTAPPPPRLGNDHASEQRMTLVMLGFDNVPVPKEEKPNTRRRTRSAQRRRTAAR
jgi:hypothetical protein